MFLVVRMASALRGFDYYVGFRSADQSEEIEAVVAIYQLMAEDTSYNIVLFTIFVNSAEGTILVNMAKDTSDGIVLFRSS